MKNVLLIGLLFFTLPIIAQVDEGEIDEGEMQEQDVQRLFDPERQLTGEEVIQFFTLVRDSFLVKYPDLGPPEVNARYEQTIGQIEDLGVLKPYENFVTRYNKYLDRISGKELPARYETDYDILNRLIAQLSTYTYLRKEMLTNGKDVVPGGLGKIYKGDQWYEYFFRHYNGGAFTEVHKLKAYARSKTKSYQQEIESQMEELGYNNEAAFYKGINSEKHYIKDSNKLLNAAVEKAASVRMGAGNLYGIDLPELKVKLSDGTTSLDAADQVLYLENPEKGYHKADLDYDIIRWVAGHYLLAQLPQPQMRLAEFVRTDGFEDAWAMYVTRHGKRFQLYREPLSRLGNAMNNKYYAVLSRIDVGLHLDGWSEEAALKYYQNELPWLGDGEAMVSKIMQRPAYYSVAPWNSFQIENTRMSAPVTLGSKIKPAEYYKYILGQGILPLHMIFERLEEEMKE